jgi:hypothetical protein
MGSGAWLCAATRAEEGSPWESSPEAREGSYRGVQRLKEAECAQTILCKTECRHPPGNPLKPMDLSVTP